MSHEDAYPRLVVAWQEAEYAAEYALSRHVLTPKNTAAYAQTLQQWRTLDAARRAAEYALVGALRGRPMPAPAPGEVTRNWRVTP